MRDETQASHLVKMMQIHTCNLEYELALPLVMARSNKLKKLNLDDVILTGFNTLEFVLIGEESICANVLVKKVGNTQCAEIVSLYKDTVKQYDSKKYKTLKFSFGAVQSKGFKVGHTIDITHIDFEKVSLVSEAKTIAEGSLVKVDEEIAIQIKKVIK